MQSSKTPSTFRSLANAHDQRGRERLAFTLIELLIAIAIIGIMASLILTVASSASIKAHNAQVSADIQTLATGIAAFKARYGVEPPSSITLYEKSTGWTNDPRSATLIRQIWPQFDFNYTAEGGSIDINGDGVYTGDNATGDTANGAIPLSGGECLVFFLGGIPATTSPLGFGGTPAGFSQNPADPFSVTISGGTRTVVGTTRVSFTEFDKNRLLLYAPTGGSQHTMNTYVDPLSGQKQPYLYLSSYGGQGYNIAELVNSLSAPTAAAAPGGTFIDVYRQGQQGYWQATTSIANLPSSAPYPAPYQPESAASIGTTANTNTPTPPWNPNSYQIISPGGDGLYGVGGEYETASANALLAPYAGSTIVDRTGERDNITNFSAGTLASQ